MLSSAEAGSSDSDFFPVLLPPVWVGGTRYRPFSRRETLRYKARTNFHALPRMLPQLKSFPPMIRTFFGRAFRSVSIYLTSFLFTADTAATLSRHPSQPSPTPHERSFPPGNCHCYVAPRPPPNFAFPALSFPPCARPQPISAFLHMATPERSRE